jgi:ectoine hydroxylase-related dioxygenase (phytanoyl-CoA dioxygenase family)
MNAWLEEYRERGIFRLGRVLDDAALARLRARADQLMLGELRYPGMFFQRDSDTGRYEDLEHGAHDYLGATLDYRKIEKLELDPIFLEVIEHPRFAELAADLIEGSGASLYRAVMFNKSARGGTPLPFHQDGGKMWGIDRDPAFQVWVAIDDAPAEAGCLEIIPGSHKDGLASPLGGVVPEAMVAKRLASESTEYLPARAGDALILHNYLWHRSGTTSTGRPRRALSICYLDDRTRCTRTRRAPREFRRIFAARTRSPSGP